MLKEIRGVYTPFSYAYQPRLKTFYRDEMAPPARAGYSQSPQKPRLFIDLDGHFGNSIEDSRSFCKDLDLALPQQYHINPTGTHGDYHADLGKKLETLQSGLLALLTLAGRESGFSPNVPKPLWSLHHAS
jgi:hypothetical protein